MPTLDDAYFIAVNALLNVYEQYLNLAFGVLHHRVISSDADFLYVHAGLRDSLTEQLETVRAQTPPDLLSKLPESENAVPVTSLSKISTESYTLIQHSFGDIKEYANEVGATGQLMPDDTAALISSIKAILSGEPLQQQVLLSEVTVSNYDGDRSQLTINDTAVAFRGMELQDCFNRIMFSYPVNTEVSWDLINDEFERRFGDGEGFTSWDSMRQAMYRINRHIRNTVGTKDDFYTQKRKIITRHYGPGID